jgi:hypothetical protein
LILNPGKDRDYGKDSAREIVELNPVNFNFNEMTLTEYLQKEVGFYNYFGGALAHAEKIHADLEVEADRLQMKTLTLMKDEGKTDKYAEATSKCADDVVEAKLKVNEAYLNVQLLKQHLRSWDKNHENAQSLGHFVRKEMEKLGKDNIPMPVGGVNIEDLVNRRLSHVDADGNVV